MPSNERGGPSRRIASINSKYTEQPTESRISCAAAAAGIFSPYAATCQSISRRRRGRRTMRSTRGSILLESLWLRSNSVRRRFSSRVPDSHPPAGAMPTTERARPRLASSSAIQPPSELPTRWAVSSPAASMSRSTASTRAPSDTSLPSGISGPPTCPARLTASTSWSRSSDTSTGCHTPRVAENPWIRTSGSPGIRGNPMGARERLASGAVDLDLDELAGRGETVEVDHLVVARAPPKPRGVGPRGPFHEHLERAPQESLGTLVGAPLDHLDEPLHPLDLDLMGHLVGQGRRLGAAPRGVDERERAVVADLVGDLERPHEVRLGLARKTDDDVGGERAVGDVLADHRDP